MKLVTQDQFYGWVAHTDNYDGPGSPIGSGRTETEAVDDLLEILEDDEQYGEFVESVRQARRLSAMTMDELSAFIAAAATSVLGSDHPAVRRFTHQPTGKP